MRSTSIQAIAIGFWPTKMAETFLRNYRWLNEHNTGLGFQRKAHGCTQASSVPFSSVCQIEPSCSGTCRMSFPEVVVRRHE